MAHYKPHYRASSAGFPVFNNIEKPQINDAMQDRFQIKGLAEHSLPIKGFNNTAVDTTADYYHCGGQRGSKAFRNSSAPKPRPPARSNENESSRRVNSMRILSSSARFNASSKDGLPLDWRDDSHSSLLRPRKGHLDPNLNSSMDSSVSISMGLSQELSSKGINKLARQQSPAGGKTKAAFKYLNAKMVAEKLVKALTKDRSSHGDTEKSVIETPKGKKASSNSKINANANPKINGSVNPLFDGISAKHNGHLSKVNGNGNSSSPPRASIEEDHYTTIYPDGKPRDNRLINPMLEMETNANPSSENISYYEVTDPLEARARSLEEQAAMLGTGNELSDVLIRTLVEDGECEYDTLEIHIDVLRKEFRKHIEDKRELALQMAAELRGRLSERASAEEALRRARAEMEGKVRMMEREKVEFKNRLQEDMEESESQWVSKFEKVRSKEKRLSERLKEIAEEKVELHKEIASLTTKKNALVEEVQECQQTIKSLKNKADESVQEALKLQKALEDSMARSSEKVLEGSMARSSEKVLEGSMAKLSEEECTTLARKYRHKEKELLEKQKAVSKLQKLCKEQEKSIQGLRFALGEQASNAQLGKGEFFIKLQRELVRLTGIEQGLRKEMEAYKGEALAAKRENASLIERLSTIMRKLGNAAIRMADYNDDLEDPQNVTKPNYGANPGLNGDGSVMKLEEIDAVMERKSELDLSSNNMAIVLLGQAPKPAENVNVALAANNPRLSEADDLSCSGLEPPCREGQELEKLQQVVKNLSQIQARLQQEADNLHNALSLTNRRVHELETQLLGKEQELGGVHEELGRVREQRDAMQKEADFMGREAIRLSAQVDRLSRKVEKLDEDVMVKEGQLSILRGALEDGSE